MRKTQHNFWTLYPPLLRTLYLTPESHVIYKLPLIRLILHQVSPQLVIAYAIAGRIDIDFEREPLGYAYTNGSPVFLSEIWPSQKEVRQAEHGLVIPAIFR